MDWTERRRLKTTVQRRFMSAASVKEGERQARKLLEYSRLWARAEGAVILQGARGRRARSRRRWRVSDGAAVTMMVLRHVLQATSRQGPVGACRRASMRCAR